MVQLISAQNGDTRRGILPVIIPAACLVILSGASGVYTFVRSDPGTKQKSGADAVAGMKGFNSTEKTFSEYSTALEFLGGDAAKPRPTRQQEMAALRQIGGLSEEPISMDGDSFRSSKLRHFSPQTVLLSVTQSLAKGAKRAAKEGDLPLAREYVDALYAVGDHVLSTPTPSLRALESAHHFLGFAARVQSSVFTTNEHYGMDARYRQWALTALWDQRISPKIGNKRARSESENDKTLAAVLAREYRTSWSQIRAGEA